MERVLKRIFIIPLSKGVQKSRGTGQRGFSLLEILITLVIASLVVALATTVNFGTSNREHLENTMEKLERAVRFAVDEAVLRNRMVRLHFILDTYPQEFAVEFGPDGDFVLPKKMLELDNADNLGETEREAQAKLLKDVNRQFNRVREFQEENEVLPEEVQIVGVGVMNLGKLIYGPNASIFVYPVGEKDGAMIILQTAEEIGTLVIEEFNLNFKRHFEKAPPLEDDGEEVLSKARRDMVEKLFTDWLRNKN